MFPTDTLSGERTPLLPQLDYTSSTSSITISFDDTPDHLRDIEQRSDSPEPETHASQAPTAPSVGRTVSVLLLGTLIANADASLVFATHTVIASEFHALHDSSWLMTSFALAQAATLPLYGKLSDIYGRKPMLLVAYALFALGCALTGAGTSMATVILGRVVSGSGASGMTALVSILITDLVPLRDVATWRSYVNVAATSGRSIGGPLGGWLADSAVGWRGSFTGQVPLAVASIVLVALAIPSDLCQESSEELSAWDKLVRIDFIGAISLTLSILGLLVPLAIGGDRVSWTSPTIAILFAGAAVFGALFLVTEGWLANEPIVPLLLLSHRDVVVSALIMVVQAAAQVGLMYSIPLYFQVTAGATNLVAGAHLIPAVAGNVIGGILSGSIVKRTGRYKAPILLATVISSSSYLLLILCWRGKTTWFEALYIFPGGFGMGIVQSALFISVQAGIDHSHTAIAASTLYLASSIGALSGLAGASAVLQNVIRSGLDHRLSDLGFQGDVKRKIIQHAVSDVHYVDRVKSDVAKAVMASYINGLTWTHVLSLVYSTTAFIGSLCLRQHKLRR